MKLTFPGCVFLLPDSRFSLLCGARDAVLSAKNCLFRLQDSLSDVARLTVLPCKIDYLGVQDRLSCVVFRVKKCFCVSNTLYYNALAKIRHNSSVRRLSLLDVFCAILANFKSQHLADTTTRFCIV